MSLTLEHNVGEFSWAPERSVISVILLEAEISSPALCAINSRHPVSQVNGAFEFRSQQFAGDLALLLAGRCQEIRERIAEAHEVNGNRPVKEFV
jgi:hypothetical protein